ncbi:MAG: TonB-dependent receptor, partial [Pedobacter sp.]
MRKKVTLLVSMVLTAFTFCFAQDVVVKGSIKDKDGAPLPGVSVNVKSSKNAVSSNGDGAYAIGAPPSSTLVFTMLGYVTQEVPVNNKTTIDVVLLESVSQLTDVVVIGYGTAQKKDITGA